MSRRARRQTLRRGNLTGPQRHRLRARLEQIVGLWRPGRPGAYARGGTPGMRDARRLAEAGLVVAVVSKSRPWGPWPTEVTLFATRGEAEKHGGPLMPGRRS